MSKSELRAFHNDPAIKEKYINRLKDHYSADEIIKGQYWEKGKGCAVGCTIHSGEHSNYETELGIPTVIARIEDRIFENLPNELAKEFPLQLLSAINVGADLSDVWNYFAIWLLTDAEYGVLQYAKNKKIVQDIANAYLEDITTLVTPGRWIELRKNASVACDSAAAFLEDITTPATTERWQELRKNADAAYAADSAAAYASDSAATYASASSTAYASASSDYASTAYGSIYQWYIAASQKLIELLKGAKS